MAIDMNLDLGALVKGLFSKDQKGGKGKKAQSPFLRHIIIGVLIFLAVIAYIFLVHLPGQKEIREKQAMINSIGQIKEEIVFLDERISEKRQEKQEAENRFEELSRLFHDKQEVEELYSNMSMLALNYNMLVESVEKGQEVPVFSEKSNSGCSVQNEENNTDQSVTKKEVAFYKIEVNFELSGDYEMYTFFRSDLAQLKKYVNIERETITVQISSEENYRPDGSVQISATLSTFRFPSNDAERCILDSGFS